ncbi:unnamed protein product [Moneuplotes crassus]|uniref:Uncharacterized protein n=1 Tax=Euplotes crassus TaxID=5936 RepID=A0AAD1XE96_EUPCR|nr:unnamed protein product [Moneuplotes crassus]
MGLNTQNNAFNYNKLQVSSGLTFHEDTTSEVPSERMSQFDSPKRKLGNRKYINSHYKRRETAKAEKFKYIEDSTYKKIEYETPAKNGSCNINFSGTSPTVLRPIENYPKEVLVSESDLDKDIEDYSTKDHNYCEVPQIFTQAEGGLGKKIFKFSQQSSTNPSPHRIEYLSKELEKFSSSQKTMKKSPIKYSNKSMHYKLDRNPESAMEVLTKSLLLQNSLHDHSLRSNSRGNKENKLDMRKNETQRINAKRQSNGRYALNESSLYQITTPQGRLSSKGRQIGYSQIHKVKKATSTVRRPNFHKSSQSLNCTSTKGKTVNRVSPMDKSRSPSMSKSSRANDKYIYNRLEQDLLKILQSSIVTGPANGKVNYEDFVNIMFHLGFIVSESTARTPFAEAELNDRENKLLIKIWSHLKGKYKGYINLDNIKVYLAGILNVDLSFMYDRSYLKTTTEAQNKRDFSPSLTFNGLLRSQSNNRYAGMSTSTQQVKNMKSKKTGYKSVGVFTTKGRFLFRNKEEIRKIHSYYKLLSVQRLKYVSQTPRNGLDKARISKTKVLYQNFRKEHEDSSVNSSGYFGKSFYEESKKRSCSRSSLAKRSHIERPIEGDVCKSTVRPFIRKNVPEKAIQIKCDLSQKYFESMSEFEESQISKSKNNSISDDSIRETLRTLSVKNQSKDPNEKSEEERSLTIFKCSDNTTDYEVASNGKQSERFDRRQQLRRKSKADPSLRYYLPSDKDSENHDQEIYNFKQSFVSMTDKTAFYPNNFLTTVKESDCDGSKLRIPKEKSSYNDSINLNNTNQSSRVKEEGSQLIVKGRPNRPYLFIDVIINQDYHPLKESISVFEGDTAESLAMEFIKEHSLNEEIIENLTNMIKHQIAKVKNNSN